MYIEEEKQVSDGTELSIDFGKNGRGLSDELIIIGKKIEELSKTNRVYLMESFIDQADDVYQFKLLYFPKPEGE